MKEIWKYLVPGILGIVIGYLVCLQFSKPSAPEELRIVETDQIGPVTPDTVIRIDPAQAKELRKAYLNVESLKRQLKYLKDNPEIEIKYVEREKSDDYMDLPLFESSKDFEFINLGVDLENKPFVYGTFSAYSPLPVESMTSSLTVRWSDYYELNMRPKWDLRLKEEKRTATLKGLSAGIVAAGGLAAGFYWDNPYYAIGGLALGSGIIIFF